MGSCIMQYLLKEFLFFYFGVVNGGTHTGVILAVTKKQNTILVTEDKLQFLSVINMANYINFDGYSMSKMCMQKLSVFFSLLKTMKTNVRLVQFNVFCKQKYYYNKFYYHKTIIYQQSLTICMHLCTNGNTILNQLVKK